MNITKNGVGIGKIVSGSPSADLIGVSKFVLEDGLNLFVSNEEVIHMYNMIKYYYEQVNGGKDFDEEFEKYFKEKNTIIVGKENEAKS